MFPFLSQPIALSDHLGHIGQFGRRKAFVTKLGRPLKQVATCRELGSGYLAVGLGGREERARLLKPGSACQVLGACGVPIHGRARIVQGSLETDYVAHV
jgi:hypothetical protein